MDEFVVRLNPKSSTEGNASSSVEVDITSDAATSSCGHNYETQTPVKHENDPESGEEFEGEGNSGPANPWPYMSAFFMFEKAVTSMLRKASRRYRLERIACTDIY